MIDDLAYEPFIGPEVELKFDLFLEWAGLNQELNLLSSPVCWSSSVFFGATLPMGYSPSHTSRRLLIMKTLRVSLKSDCVFTLNLESLPEGVKIFKILIQRDLVPAATQFVGILTSGQLYFALTFKFGASDPKQVHWCRTDHCRQDSDLMDIENGRLKRWRLNKTLF